MAKLDNDRMMIRQEIEQLQTSLEKDANSAEVLYNLACAFALLDQPEPAMRHLRACLQNDSQRTFYNAATTDPDLNALRRTAEFNELVSPSSAGVTPLAPRPSISDR